MKTSLLRTFLIAMLAALSPAIANAQLADLAITKTDGSPTAIPGASVTYTIVVSNAGPNGAPASNIADALPVALTGATWTCVGAGGGTCTAAGSGNINDSADLPAGASVTYTLTATVAPSATGTLTNTATVTAGAGITDPNAGNNSATDSDALSAAPAATAIPTLSEYALMLLAILVAAAGVRLGRGDRRLG